jgi:hypothetical protein
MGYYVNIEDCDFVIEKNQLEPAYNALVNLNTNVQLDALKHHSNVPGRRYFAWMDADFHLNLKSVAEILENLGFDVTTGDDESIIDLSYNNKSGDEEIFLAALAPYVKDSSYIVFCGEDYERCRYSFKNGKMFLHNAKVVYSAKGKIVSLENLIDDKKRFAARIESVWNEVNAHSNSEEKR